MNCSLNYDCNCNINEEFELKHYDSDNESNDFHNNYDDNCDKVSETDVEPRIDDFYQENYFTCNNLRINAEDKSGEQSNSLPKVTDLCIKDRLLPQKFHQFLA